jgi:hypothetical protein
MMMTSKRRSSREALRGMANLWSKREWWCFKGIAVGGWIVVLGAAAVVGC